MTNDHRRDKFTEKGYCFLPTQFSQSDLFALREAIHFLEKEQGVQDYGILRHNLYQKVPLFYSMIDKYKLGNLACDLLGSKEVILFQDNLIWKPSGTMQSIAWHQDYAYWPLSKPAGITFWIALDDTNRNNGCMQYVPYSHLWGECEPTNFIQQGTQQPTKLEPLPILSQEYPVIDIELPAGSAVAHHPLLAHKSGPNTSKTHRRGWSLTWISTDVLWDPEHAPHPYPVFQTVQKGDTVEGKDFPKFSLPPHP